MLLTWMSGKAAVQHPGIQRLRHAELINNLFFSFFFFLHLKEAALSQAEQLQ